MRLDSFSPSSIPPLKASAPLSVNRSGGRVPERLKKMSNDFFRFMELQRLDPLFEGPNLAKVYHQWHLTIKGSSLVLKTADGERQVVKTTKTKDELKALRHLFKPSTQEKFSLNQGRNGDCTILATLQDMMMTGKQIDALVKAIDVTIDPKNKNNPIYHITFYDQDKKPCIYNYTLQEIQRYTHANQSVEGGRKLAYSSTHQTLVSLISMALRPFSLETGFNNEANGVFKGPYASNNSIWTDGGFHGQFLRALDPDTVIDVYHSKEGILYKDLMTPFHPWQSNVVKKPKPEEETARKTALGQIERLTPTQVSELLVQHQKNLVAVSHMGVEGTKLEDTYAGHAYTLLADNNNAYLINPQDNSKPRNFNTVTFPLFHNLTVAYRPQPSSTNTKSFTA